MSNRDKIIGLLLILASISSGCTVKLAGEASMMKQWDRPAETTVTSTVDTSSNAKAENLKASPQQGGVGVVK